MRAIVTGSNRGIGLELCKQLKAKKYQVIALCRRASEDLVNLDVQIIENVDVKNFEKLKEVCTQIKDPIDLLINNAGIYIKDDIKSLNFKMLEEQFEVNSIAPLKATLAFLPLMQKNSKIAMISSLYGSISEVDEAKSYGYRASKAALNMFSKVLSQDLKALGVSVGIFHPGYVKTDMTSHLGNLTPEESVKNILKLIDMLDLKKSGNFFHQNGSIIPW